MFLDNKTAQKPPKNRKYGGLAVLQISIIHNFHNSPVWWVEMMKILENRLKTYKNAQKPPKNRHIGGLAVFQILKIHNFPN